MRIIIISTADAGIPDAAIKALSNCLSSSTIDDRFRKYAEEIEAMELLWLEALEFQKKINKWICSIYTYILKTSEKYFIMKRLKLLFNVSGWISDKTKKIRKNK